MRRTTSLLTAVAGVVLLAAGCSGPEQKLGRGINNLTEFTRMGEIRRSVEQTALWDGPDVAYTTGSIRGFNRSVARTFMGIYEVATFPIPSYEPLFPNEFPANPVYPESSIPGLVADPTFMPDRNLGFTGEDVIPMVPGSRFRIFD